MRLSVTGCLSLEFFAASLFSAVQIPSNPPEIRSTGYMGEIFDRDGSLSGGKLYSMSSV